MKRIGILLLALVMLLQTAPIISFAEESEVVENAELMAFKENLEVLGLFNYWSAEDDIFNENETVKRFEVAEILVKFLGYETMSGGNNGVFFDVPDYYEHSGAISIVSSMGVMTGVGDGLFGRDGEISKNDFIKCVIHALGYGWQANIEGGYPAGYTTVAARLNIAKGTTGDASAPLTRGDLIRILYNSLEIPVYEIISVTGESVQLSTENQENVLSYFHKIYSDKEVVNSDKSISLKEGFDPDEKEILIGNRKVLVNGVLDIYNYLGYSVKYYYHYNAATEKNELLLFEPVAKNNVIELGWRDIKYANTSKVVIEKENGKEDDFTLNSKTKFVYNGEIVKTNINSYLSAFSFGLKLIDANSDNKFDVVFIYDYEYDEITANGIERNKTLYCKNNSYDFSAAEVINVFDEAGNVLKTEELVAGDVIEFSKSASGEVINITVLDNAISPGMFATGENSIKLAEGEEYYFSKNLSAAQQQEIFAFKSGILVLNRANEIVWVIKAQTGGLTLGYLMKVAGPDPAKPFETDTRLKILTTSGTINIFDCRENVMVDEVKIKEENLPAKLAEIKESLGLYSDGVYTQLISYELNDEGLISSILTAKSDKLTLNYNCSPTETLRYRRYGRYAGTLGGMLPLLRANPMFRVPREGQDTAEDKQFTVGTSYELKVGGKFSIEHYTAGPDAIDPCATVLYQTASTSADKLVLVEEVFEKLGDGITVTALAGYDTNGKGEWTIESDALVKISTGWENEGTSTATQTFTEVSIKDVEINPGDIYLVLDDGFGTVSYLDKVYDYETRTIVGAHRVDYDAPYKNLMAAREADQYIELNVYDAPSGSQFMKTYINWDLKANGVPDMKYLHTFSFAQFEESGTGILNFDTKNEKAGVGKPPIVDFKHDPDNYARLVLFTWDTYLSAPVVVYY